VLAQAADLVKSHAGAAAERGGRSSGPESSNHPQAFPQELTGGLTRPRPDWGSKISLLSYYGTVDPERILPAVLLRHPGGAAGTAPGRFPRGSHVHLQRHRQCQYRILTRDLYQGYIRPKAKTKELIYASCVFGALVMLAGFAAAYSTKKISTTSGAG
jgi:hypothetical protein